MSDADYEWEDYCICGHSGHDHYQNKRGPDIWGRCLRWGCRCEKWTP